MDEKSQAIRENFGRNLKKARKVKKMTQDDLSAEIGVQRNTVSMYEGGNSMPGETIIQKIMIALDISRDDLFDIVKYSDPAMGSGSMILEDKSPYQNHLDIKPGDDILNYLVALESKDALPKIVAQNLKTLVMQMYKQMSDDKEALVVQMKKYEALRDYMMQNLDNFPTK
ncbi:helix-turn-helix domain-containing protein [Reichenbachiella sp.]|uniref:helix-turn-helix domain-containing protein n=1 Tax=Reichenbachiella sp. TaxID=2184521 RepID=UPI003B59A9E0